MPGITPPAGTPAPRTAAEIEAELLSIDTAIHDQDLNPDDPDGQLLQKPDAEALRAEADATRKGWVPKDKYTGDPARWVDAKTFLERGEKFNANLQREIAGLKKQLEAFEGTRKQFVKFHEETIAAKDKQIADAIQQLRVQKSQATADGDHEGAVQIEDRIDLLRDQRKELKAIPADHADAVPAAPPDPLQALVVQEWVEDGNDWFRDNAELRTYALTLGESLLKAGETKRGREFLDLIADHMAKDFPRTIGKTRKTPHSDSVEPSSPAAGGRKPGGKTERDLPAEDLKLMREFVAAGWTTKEKFLESYFSR